jgi:hypothetical protein
MWPADIITPTTSACAIATANKPTSEPDSSLSVHQRQRIWFYINYTLGYNQNSFNENKNN